MPASCFIDTDPISDYLSTYDGSNPTFAANPSKKRGREASEDRYDIFFYNAEVATARPHKRARFQQDAADYYSKEVKKES